MLYDEDCGLGGPVAAHLQHDRPMSEEGVGPRPDYFRVTVLPL